MLYHCYKKLVSYSIIIFIKMEKSWWSTCCKQYYRLQIYIFKIYIFWKWTRRKNQFDNYSPLPPLPLQVGKKLHGLHIEGALVLPYLLFSSPLPPLPYLLFSSPLPPLPLQISEKLHGLHVERALVLGGIVLLDLRLLLLAPKLLAPVLHLQARFAFAFVFKTLGQWLEGG